MTNKEIDKLLSMLDKKGLEKVKDFLLKEKTIQESKLRQDTFEKYLKTNKFGLNFDTTPKLYDGEKLQKFTNGVSVYIINKEFFKTNTPKLIKASAKGARSNHKFEFVDEQFFEQYILKSIDYFGDVYSECTDYIETREYDTYTYVEYYNELIKDYCIEKFDREETDCANIILNNPTYYISHDIPILKAESDVGKCYIFGFRKNKSK